jgi:biotin transporter BioY
MLLISLVWPRLDWDNPRRQTSGTASLVGAACGLILAGATCFLLVLTFIWSDSNAAGAWASGAGIFILSGLVIAVAAALAPRRLNALLHRD